MPQPKQVDTGLGRFLVRVRGALLAVGVFGVFINILMLTLPFYMLNVFSTVLMSRSAETLVMLTIAATVALTVQAALELVRSRVLVRVGVTLDESLSREVLRSLVRGSQAGEAGNSQGLRDVGELRNYLSGPGLLSLFDAPFVPLYVAVIWMLHPTLGTVALVGAVITLALGVMAEYLTRGPWKEASLASSRSMAIADDYLRNSDAVRAMGMLPAVMARWDQRNARMLSDLALASDRAGTVSAFVKFARFMVQVSMYAAGAYIFIFGQTVPGAMIAAAVLMGRALAPLELAVSTWKGTVSARAAYDRVKASLAQGAEPNERFSLPAPAGRLSVERVMIGAGGTDALLVKGVSLTLEPGEMLGIIGPSGAGKTTLARSIVGLVKPRVGAIRLDGADIYHWDPDDLGRHIGYVPQDVQLFPGTVAENIARMHPNPPAEAVIEAARKAGAHDFILRLPHGYDTQVGQSGMRLSAGQRQHVALARALFGSPSLLVLDEPNSNLDGASEMALVAALAIAKEEGKALIVISHRPSIVEGAERLLVMRDGAAEVLGPRAEVMARLAGGPRTERPAVPYPSAVQRLALAPLKGDAAG